MVRMCPNCGYNLERDAYIERGDWSVSQSEAVYKGIRQPLTVREAQILHTLANTKGFMLAETIGIRLCGDEVEDPANTITVLVCRIRKKLGNILPIQSHGRYGYRWKE